MANQDRHSLGTDLVKWLVLSKCKFRCTKPKPWKVERDGERLLAALGESAMWGTGCVNRARPGLWGTRLGNDPSTRPQLCDGRIEGRY